MFKKGGNTTPRGLHHASSDMGQRNIEIVQQDWEDRDFTQSICHGAAQLVAFLNEFDATARGKLANLNSKLAKLERRMEMVEATLQSVDQGA